MKVLLIRPHNKGNINTRLPESLNRRQGVLPPLGIAYVASSLEKAGHTVKILDAIALNLVDAEMRQAIRVCAPDVVGVSVMTSTLFGALEAAKIAKAEGAITVLGGPHLSIYPEETLSYPYIDYGVNGEGELVMCELLAALAHKTPVSAIRGLIYKEGGRVVVNEAVLVDELDTLPLPAYHLLPMKKYDSIIGRAPVSTMVSTRGCPFHCQFCFKTPSDKKFRLRSPKNVVDEMEYLVKGYQVREIMFYDDVITLNREHIEGICKELLSRNFRVAWESPTRADLVDAELLGLMKRAGCIRLRYGVESGDEEILRLMNKKIDLALVRNAFALTKKAGIETFAYFIIGYAHETRETIMKTINFAVALNPDLVMFTTATPYPQTPLYDLAMQEGLIKTDYWRDFTLGKIKDERIPFFMPEADVWTKKAYQRFYLRPGYIMSRLAKLRTLDDVKKSWRALAGIVGAK